MSNLYRGCSIDATYQFIFRCGQSVAEEKNLKKLTNQKQELPVAAMFFNGSERNVYSL
jgi:hypothetical protein